MWNIHVERVIELKAQSRELRSELASFSASKGKSKHITSNEHQKIDSLMSKYSKISKELHEIQSFWNSKCDFSLTSCAESTALCLAADAVLLENETQMTESFKNTIWAQRINSGPANKDNSYEMNLFDKVSLSLYSPERRRNCLNNINGLSMYEADIYSLLSSNDPSLRTLVKMITSSDAIDEITGETYLSRNAHVVLNKTKLFTAKVKSFFAGLFEKASRHFGNTAGDIKFGETSIKGKTREKVLKELDDILQPGDILLDKVEVALTDKLIPGYFGHAAIWLGTPSQLKKLDYWKSTDKKNSSTYPDSSQFMFYEDLMTSGVTQTSRHKNSIPANWKKKISSGHTVIEALRTGVQLNSLDHFLDIDQILVVRAKKKYVSYRIEKLQNQLLARGVVHLGKKYDFNFDLNSPQKIFCSELVYLMYSDIIPWFTMLDYSQKRVDPIDIANLSGRELHKPFEIIYYFTNGKSYKGKKAERILKKNLSSK